MAEADDGPAAAAAAGSGEAADDGPAAAEETSDGSWSEIFLAFEPAPAVDAFRISLRTATVVASSTLLSVRSRTSRGNRIETPPVAPLCPAVVNSVPITSHTSESAGSFTTNAGLCVPLTLGSHDGSASLSPSRRISGGSSLAGSPSLSRICSSSIRALVKPLPSLTTVTQCFAPSSYAPSKKEESFPADAPLPKEAPRTTRSTESAIASPADPASASDR